ncbi:MAG: anti-sigma factor [Phycisphaerae bacterium]
MTKSRRTLLLGAYADGELPQSESARVETMLREHGDAAAIVAQTQSLRGIVRNSLVEVDVPASLRSSILEAVRADRRGSRARTIKLFIASGFAAAALVVLSITVVGSRVSGSAPRVERPAMLTRTYQASRIADIYLECANTEKHDELGVAGRSLASANRMLRSKELLPVAGPELPDLSERGMSLVSACNCATENEVTMLQATYQAAEPGDKTLSVFVSDNPVRLVCGGTEVATLQESGRAYQMVKLRDGLVVVKWDVRQSSVALCSRMNTDEILKLANAMDVSNSAGSLAIILLP